MTKDSNSAQEPHQITPEAVARERNAIEWHGRLRFVHWLIVVLSVIITIVLWQYAKRQIELRTEARFDVAAENVAELIRERLQKYELALLAGVSTLHTHENEVDLATWRRFAESLDIEQRYPGINGIGVIHDVTRLEVPEYLARQRVARPDFAIHPAREDILYQPITFIEPEDINAAAVGLDMMHETNRRTALAKARDTGTTQITGPIVLVQDETRTPGFLFFAPFYEDADQTTVERSTTNFAGAVYAPFVVNRLMEGVLDKDRRRTALRITDGDEVIYDEIDKLDIDYDQDSLGEKRIAMSLYGREWTLYVRAGLEFRSDNSGFESTAILIIGIILDFALLALFILLSRANRRGLRFADMATSALEVANTDLDRARREAESASDMKSAFLSTMSHEVRTPLTAISGILELLERAGLPEKQARLIEAGKTASGNLIKLLTDVLDVSRLEADAMELWERDVELRPLMGEWRLLAKGLVDRMGKDVEVTSIVEDDVPETIHVDDIRLSQVMSNLMDNAVRFTEKGTITINVCCAHDDGTDSPRVRFSITDTGSGIAESDLPLIFARFSQVDTSMTREASGAGLGLSICSELIKLMGGDINVSSTVGVGTTFEIDLPVDGVSLKGENLD